jgi:hypothetical protein
MAYGITYRHRFTNTEGYVVTTLIHKVSTFGAPDPEIFDLEPSGNPLTLSVVDSNEDKYTPIRAKQLTIRFLSDTYYNMSTFVDGVTDDGWAVETYMEDPFIPIFTGFLVIGDISETFADHQNRNEVILTATDMLGLLRDTPLTKPDGTNPKGHFKIIEFVAWALSKTGIPLDINVMNNLMEEDYVGLPAWNNIYLDAKTFESSEIGISISCYDVLVYILGTECFLTQWKLGWWVRRINEYDWNPKYYDNYTSEGLYVQTYDNQDYSVRIGHDEDVYPIQPWGRVMADLANKSVTIEYDYETPKEIIDNIDFSRGDFLSPIVVPGGAAYDLDDWDVRAGTFTANVTPDVNAYIARLFTDSVETERYVVITEPTSGNKQWIQSNPVPVHFMDRIRFQASMRTGLFGTTFGGDHRVQVIFVNNAGDVFTLIGDPYSVAAQALFGGPPAYTWTPYTGQPGIGFQTTTGDGWVRFDTGDNTPLIPEDGYLYFCLPAQPNDYINWNNLQLDYYPYINASYVKYTGQEHKMSRDIEYKSKKELSVKISDSPKRLFKGALEKPAASGYQLTGKWYDGSVPAIRDSPGVDDLHPLGFIQAYEVWNQYRTVNRLIEGAFKGIRSATDIPDLMHTYFLVDYSQHTNQRDFMLLRFEMDLHLCEWSGYFAEVFNRATGRDYGDDHSFKFIENR